MPVHGRSAPFTSDVSGQDFAKLIRAGWVPVGLAHGISIGSRHDDRDTTRQARWISGNAEVAGWTDLVGQSRHDARRQLESDVKRLGAEGVVIAAMPMRVRQRDCPAAVGRRDHIVEAIPHRYRRRQLLPGRAAVPTARRWPSCRSTRSAARPPESGSSRLGAFKPRTARESASYGAIAAG